MAGVTYDTGALVAGERNDRRMWALHVGFLAEEVTPVVPAAVLAQAWRGGARQASLSRMLGGCEIDDLTGERGRAVGELAGRSGIPDIVDVSVIEVAFRRGTDVVVTSDKSEIQQVARVVGRRIRIEAL